MYCVRGTQEAANALVRPESQACMDGSFLQIQKFLKATPPAASRNEAADLAAVANKSHQIGPTSAKHEI